MNKTLVTLAALLAFGLAGSSWAGPDPQAATNAKKAKAAAKAASEPEGKKLACGGHGPRDENIQRSKKAKRKIDRNKKDANGVGQGVVAWDVEVTNQHDEVVASYDILTLVAKRG